MSKWDYILAPLFIVGACYFALDAIKDMRRGENRPVVTDGMVISAIEDLLQSRSDAELENMDWMSDDDE